MRDIDCFRWMKRYGYLRDVPLAELEKLDMNSRPVRDNARLLQSAMYSESQIGIADGVIGDFTRAAMLQPRCGHPDFADPELALGYGTGGSTEGAVKKLRVVLDCDKDEATNIIAAHFKLKLIEDMDNRAVGSGSWPQPCQKGGVTVSWDTSNAPRGLDTDALWEMCRKAYWDIGVNLVKHTGGNRANIRVWWRVLSGSTIGLAEFNNQSCGDSVFCNLDPGYFPNLLQVAELLKHEYGHNMNLQHTRGGTMNPSILRVSNIAWTSSDPSYRTLVRYFGGDPVGPDPNPDPDPVPGPEPIPGAHGFIWINGETYVQKLTKV